MEVGFTVREHTFPTVFISILYDLLSETTETTKWAHAATWQLSRIEHAVKKIKYFYIKPKRLPSALRWMKFQNTNLQ